MRLICPPPRALGDGQTTANNTASFLPDRVKGVGKEKKLPTAVIDFQWSGVGLGAQDVIYLLVTSAHHDVLGNADSLIKFYHKTLCNHLPGGEEGYPFSVFLKHYRIAALDYMRMLFACVFDVDTRIPVLVCSAVQFECAR